MKHPFNLSVLFCILFLAGCRTTKSVEVTKASTDEQLSVVETSVMSFVCDTINSLLTFSADSLFMEWADCSDTIAVIKKRNQMAIP